jgi:hypothetical protein
MKLGSRAWLALLTSAVVFSGGGCAEEREPINKVQANALKKSFFVGEDLGNTQDDPEFYSAATVIDVPYGVNHGLFSGLAGGLKRIKWEISETTLLGRMSHETIQDVDGRGARTTNDGQVIAAFNIEKHFDIRRSYNPSTGEELNVVEENESDRAWYQREYMRVDWSKNLISSSVFWDPMAQNELGNDSYEVEQASYSVEEPEHPDAPFFDAFTRYFDITNKLYITPKTLDVEGQKLPTCLWNGVWVTGGNAQTGVCESAEIKLRLSFKRVPQPGDAEFTDYEPMQWDGARMDAFGAFFAERKGYDERYGVVDSKWYRFVQRYNIWQRSTADVSCANSADADGDGTDDECTAAGSGSSCNTFRQRCTLPYAQREVRTIAWHDHMSSDDVLYAQTERATTEWDTALRIAVQSARYVECKRTGTRSLQGTAWEGSMVEGDASAVARACAGAFPIDQGEEAELRQVEQVLACWKQRGREAVECAAEAGTVAAMKPVVVLCHNPVASTDDAACGVAGTKTRAGDLRYHSLNIWRTPEDSAPWGFGPSWADPLSGEIIQASINVYDSVTTTVAQRIIDEASWLNGELSTADVTSGQYLQSVGDAERTQPGPAASAASFRMTAEQIDRRVASARGASPTLLSNLPALRERHDVAALSAPIQDYLRLNKSSSHVQPSNRAEFDARIEAVKGSSVEAQLLGPMWSQAAGVDPNVALTGAALELASPLRSLGADKLLELENHVQRHLADHGTCVYHAPQPGGMPALGKLLQRKFPGDRNDPERARRMLDYVRGRLHYGVILHEMGHTVGLRHNFTSSFDAFNYRPQYWQLRTSGGNVTETCTGPTADGSSCVGPRYFDPLTSEEVHESIDTWAQTSVMDYSGETTQDWVGLGAYDYAAARSLYADVVDVRADDVRVNDPVGQQMRSRVDNPLSPWAFEGNRSLHYSEYNRFFGLLRNCRSTEAAPPADWDEARDGIWDPVFDGEIVRGEVCERPPVDFVGWRDMVPDRISSDYVTSPTDPTALTPRRAEDQQRRVRVPYMFNSDEFRDGWTGSTMTRDAGADAYEQFAFWINRYENRHLFDNYRRNRSDFSIVEAYTRALASFHYKMSFLAQGTSFFHDFLLGEYALNSGLSKGELLTIYEGAGGPLREEAVAASLAFDHFMRVLTRPDAGPHYSNVPGQSGLLASGDRFGFSPPAFLNAIDIPNGTTISRTGEVSFGGRPLTNGFQGGKGYHYYDYVDHIGSFYEKTFVFQAMLNATYRAPAAFSRFDGLDGRWRHTNFTNMFPEGMRRAIGSTLTEDWELIAPRLAATQSGAVDAVTNENGALVPARPMAWVSFVNQAGPELCWPTNGQYVCSTTDGTVLPGADPPKSVPIEPQVGYETQKFALFWAYVYLPGSQVMDWADMLRVYKTGADHDPGYLPAARVSFRDPVSGAVYSAKRYGDETLFGKTYDKGIAAKMVQWANQLASKAYALDETVPYDPETGAPNFQLDSSGQPIVLPDESVTPTNPDRLTCDDNRYCQKLRDYRGLLDFSRDIATRIGFALPDTGTR